MTNEEAIKILTQYIDYDAETPDYYEMEKACKVAIKALEQIPDLKEAYNKGYKDGQEALAVHLELCKEEGSVITVPEGATNGDMIKALFPEECASWLEKNCTKWWWNSPYRKE